MRSRFLLILFVLAALLAVAGAAAMPAAAAPGHHAAPRISPPAPSAGWAAPAARAAGARAAQLGGAAQVTGHVYDFGGAPLPGASVMAAVGSATAEATTDASGAFTLSGLVAASGDGSIFFVPPDGSFMDVIWNMSWPGTGADFTLQPGHVSVSIARGGPWADWGSVMVSAAGTDGSWGVSAGQSLAADTPTSNISAAPMNLLTGTYTTGVINFYTYPFSDEGIELSGPWTAKAGAPSSEAMDVAEADAQRVYVAAPLWGSGKPGVSVRLAWEGFPASGWTSAVHGYPEWGSATLARDYGTVATVGAGTRSVLVPKTAPAGYDYFFDVQHIEGPLDLTTAYQVCTLASKPASIARGGAIRLSGRIPLAGHWGTRLASAGKTIVIYKRTSSAGQPKSWTPSSWTKVAAVKTDRTGAYHSGLLDPTRTTWYVVRYPSSYSAATGQEYWGAYTSVLKVRVY